MTFDRLPELLRNQPWTGVAGSFDPLTSTEAQRLAKSKDAGKNGRSRRLLAIVVESEESLLPAQARAHLVAALGCVDLVAVASNGDWRGVLTASDVQIITDPDGDKQRTAELVDLILKRQNSEDKALGECR